MKIYLTGAVTDWDNPFEWHKSIQNNEEWSEHEFINPYELNEFDIGDDEIYDRPNEIVEPALDEVADCDGMLVNWDDDAFLVGSSMEMWNAYEHGVPIVIWYDGYRDNLSPWLLHISDGDWPEKETCVRTLLALCGDSDAIHG